jgi:hypothetical protein
MRTPYEKKKARESRQSPEKVADRKAKEALRRQLARVYRPLKKGRPLSDAICLEVIQCTTAFFLARIQPVLDANGWKWSDYGSTNYGGKWNLGHIRPMHEWNPFDPAQAKAVNHWTNLVPECARANDHKREIYSHLERQAYEANVLYASTLICD